MISRAARVRYRRIGTWGLVLLTGVMWNLAAVQLTNGYLDVVVFVPPSATLGVAAVWSAHTFTPQRFSWQRGFTGALISSALGSPLMAFLVAFSAAWDRVSFPLVFTIGALLAIASGLLIGLTGWAVRAVRAWRRKSDTPSGETRRQGEVSGASVGPL